jgi:hypothetical protein
MKQTTARETFERGLTIALTVAAACIACTTLIILGWR